MKFFGGGGVGCGPRNNYRLDFGGNMDHESASRVFKGFFIYCCDLYRQPRIKREISVRGLNSELFLVLYLFLYFRYSIMSF